MSEYSKRDAIYQLEITVSTQFLWYEKERKGRWEIGIDCSLTIFPLSYTSLFGNSKSASFIRCLHTHYYGLFLLDFLLLFTIFSNRAFLVEAELLFTCHGVISSFHFLLFPRLKKLLYAFFYLSFPFLPP